MASVLVHCCCAPCATYTLKFWGEQQHELAAHWFNPNIHPFSEYQLRLQTLTDFLRTLELPLIASPGYAMEEYFRMVAGHEKKGDRCQYCYRLRLFDAASTAREKGFDAFTTTLLISPYQKHDVLKQVGEEVQGKVGVRFLYEDLRSGFQESRRMARELNLYRQKYCGCIYSEVERFVGKALAR
jgi:hypothetical protein